MPLLTFRSLRLSVLLGLLLFTVLYTTHQLLYSRSWQTPLDVVIYPINADQQASTQHYISNLSQRHFHGIEKWFTQEAKRYRLPNTVPIKLSLGEQVPVLPPVLPDLDHPLYNMLWGVHFRWWAFRNTPDKHSNLSRVRVFVLYHSQTEGHLPYSLGFQKGLFGLVNAYAFSKQNRQNNVVIAHEVLHTVGAKDKYQADGNPIYPQGYASPRQNPLYPQQRAEIMAARIPLSATQSQTVRSLQNTVINPQTAQEINWLAID